MSWSFARGAQVPLNALCARPLLSKLALWSCPWAGLRSLCPKHLSLWPRVCTVCLVKLAEHPGSNAATPATCCGEPAAPCAGVFDTEIGAGEGGRVGSRGGCEKGWHGWRATTT